MSVARLMQMAAAGSAGAGPEPSGWTDPDLGNASYDSVGFSVAGQDDIPTTVFFKDDGLSMFVAGASEKTLPVDRSRVLDVMSPTVSPVGAASKKPFV